MCGITGFISLQNKIEKKTLQEATTLIQHRGPDAEGFYFSPDQKVGLGHRRLSILDLSESANQPMFSKDGRYCIVYNGEVYNFNELKQELLCKGSSLTTTSDTEVIIELFAQKGVGCFEKLNGIFAFAIYDIELKILTLCRDHAGIKPLFYYYDEQQFIFASEIKAIKHLVSGKLSINQKAIPYFFHLGFIPQPLTIYEHTYKFSSGHYVQINVINSSFSNIDKQITPFWKIEDKITASTQKNKNEAKLQLKELLMDSVQKQMISDVPLGTFLSGGIDSSLVTALATKVTAGSKVNTFSMAIADGKYNEAKYAKAVASYLGTNHHELEVREKDIIELVETLMSVYDEPFADSSAFPTMIVSRLAREYVTVTLSGDGGDELFHGYQMYKWATRLTYPGVSAIKKIAYSSTRLMESRYQRIGNMFAFDGKTPETSHVFSQEQYYFSKKELPDLLMNPFFNFNEINAVKKLSRKLTPAEQQSLWDFNYYLKDDLLAKVDRASMKYSLETRVPLLDFRIIEFAYNLHPDLKIHNGVKKYLLKEVLYEFVPEELFNRPKWGFSIPLAKWLKEDLGYLVEKYTSEEIITKHNVINYYVVKQIKKQYKNGISYLYNKLWLIIVLHRWLEENNIINL